jgi:1,2-diacylglycerol 3-beta-galactosyltransferase
LRAVILSARVGGHWTAAHAIAEELRDTLPRGAEINVVDVFDSPYARPAFARFAHSYELLVRLFPLLCLVAAVVMNGRRQVKLIEALAGLCFSRDAVATLLYPEQPDLIVSDALNFGQLALARNLLGERASSTRFVVMVTDPVTLHWLWWTDAADWYFVGTDVAARHCTTTFGIHPDLVRQVEMPVRAAFYERRSKQEARQALGLDPEAFTVVFMGGTSGAGAMEKFIGAVDAADLPIQKVAITGKNDALRQQLAGRFDPSRLRVHGFVDNVHEFMQAADLLVTKAGPGTITEGLASGVPVCISGHFPWTEQGNTDYYVKLGRVVHVSTPTELVARLGDVLAGADAVFAQLDRRAWEPRPAEAQGLIGRELTTVMRMPAEQATAPAATNLLATASQSPHS